MGVYESSHYVGHMGSKPAVRKTSASSKHPKTKIDFCQTWKIECKFWLKHRVNSPRLI